MQDPPTWQQLLSAVDAHFQQELIPSIDDPGLRFRARIAANLLSVVARELELGPRQAADERQRLVALLGGEAELAGLPELTLRLIDRVRAGDFDDGPEQTRLMAHLRATATERLRIANPKFLGRLEAEDGSDRA